MLVCTEEKNWFVYLAVLTGSEGKTEPFLSEKRTDPFLLRPNAFPLVSLTLSSHITILHMLVNKTSHHQAILN